MLRIVHVFERGLIPEGVFKTNRSRQPKLVLEALIVSVDLLIHSNIVCFVLMSLMRSAYLFFYVTSSIVALWDTWTFCPNRDKGERLSERGLNHIITVFENLLFITHSTPELQ